MQRTHFRLVGLLEVAAVVLLVLGLAAEACAQAEDTAIKVTKVIDGMVGKLQFEGTYTVKAGETIQQLAIVVFDDKMGSSGTKKINDYKEGKWVIILDLEGDVRPCDRDHPHGQDCKGA